MAFELINAPTIFQHLMNDVFKEYLDKFFVCYLNDILIYSKNFEEYEGDVRLVLHKFQEASLFDKLKKIHIPLFKGGIF